MRILASDRLEIGPVQLMQLSRDIKYNGMSVNESIHESRLKYLELTNFIGHIFQLVQQQHLPY